jgi:hypothetical protein
VGCGTHKYLYFSFCELYIFFCLDFFFALSVFLKFGCLFFGVLCSLMFSDIYGVVLNALNRRRVTWADYPPHLLNPSAPERSMMPEGSIVQSYPPSTSPTFVLH